MISGNPRVENLSGQAENSLWSLALRDFWDYVQKNPSMPLRFLESGITDVMNGPRSEFNLFLIPDGNARMAAVKILQKEHGLPVIGENMAKTLKKLEKGINEILRHPEEYLGLVEYEYQRSGFATSLLSRELQRHSFGDQVTCVYNEINRQDRVYFDIFEKMLNGIGQANVDLLLASRVKCFVVGSDAEKWAGKINNLEVLSRPPEKSKSRVIIIAGLYSNPKKALKKIEDEAEKIFQEFPDDSEKRCCGLVNEAIGDIIDERLEKYARESNVFLRPTHVRISGMYSSAYNNAAMGFLFSPFSSFNPASLAMQLLGAWKTDFDRLSKRLDIYSPESYALWMNHFGDNSMAAPKDFNAVLPCKRNPPFLSKISKWSEKDLEKEIKPFYSGKI